MSTNEVKHEKVLLIASYRKHYKSNSLKKIRTLIKREKPSKIVISKIIEEESPPRVVKASVGIEERQDFLKTVRRERKEKADECASDILKLTDSLDIPTEVHLRKGENISDEIIGECEKVKADDVVIHETDKDTLDKVIEGCTAEEVKERLPTKNVYPLE